MHVGRHCISMHVCTCVDHMMLYTRSEIYLLQCEVCSSALGLGYVHVGRHWLSVHVCMDSMSAGIVPTLSIHVCMDIHVCLMRYHTPGLRWMSCDASSACLRSYQDIRIGRCLHGPPSTFPYYTNTNTNTNANTITLILILILMLILILRQAPLHSSRPEAPLHFSAAYPHI